MNDISISAQVILSKQASADVTPLFEFLRAAGLTVGAMFAGSFPITAPPAVFEKLFGVALLHSPQRGVTVAGRDAAAAHELPLDSLPVAMREKIDRVIFTPLPDFGPRSY